MSQSSQPKRVTIRDIAEALGITHVTVSLALRGKGRISESTRTLVKETAKKMGYKPDPMLSALANYRLKGENKSITSSLAWLNGWKKPGDLRSYKEFDSYWHGASKTAEKHGYRLEEFQFGKGMSPKRLHQILRTRNIRGILLPPHSEQPDWGDFPWSEYSLIRFGRSLQTPHAAVVTSDQEANTLLSFKEMRKRGYRRIGFVTDRTRLENQLHLFEGGFLIAQQLVEKSERLPIFVLADFPATERSEQLRLWYQKWRPDAVISNMPTVDKIFNHIGLRVPDDIGIVGTTRCDLPMYAGINQCPVEIGSTGVRMLISQINEDLKGVPEVCSQHLVEGKWEDGHSLPDRNFQSSVAQPATCSS